MYLFINFILLVNHVLNQQLPVKKLLITSHKQWLYKHWIKTFTKNQGDIGKTWNADTVYKKMSNLLDGRGGNISEKGLDFRTDIRLTTFVPLSLVNQNNEMVFGNGGSVKMLEGTSTVVPPGNGGGLVIFFIVLASIVLFLYLFAYKGIKKYEYGG